MRRYANAEIILGFFIGIFVTLLFVGVDLYQTDHCANEQQQSDARPATKPNPEPKIAAPQNEDDEREKEITSYSKAHPGVCGIAGFPRMMVGYLDHHEGFFVGLFTMALFGATFFLWRSTEKLWAAGERQIAVTERSVSLSERTVSSMENTAEKQLRAYVGIERVYISGTDPSVPITATVVIKNGGVTPAFNEIARLGVAAYDYRIPIQLIFENNPHEVSTTLMPGGISEVRIGGLEVAAAAHAAQNRAFILAGVITYRDIFDRERFTNVRMIARPSDNLFIFDKEGNHAT